MRPRRALGVGLFGRLRWCPQALAFLLSARFSLPGVSFRPYPLYHPHDLPHRLFFGLRQSRLCSRDLLQAQLERFVQLLQCLVLQFPIQSKSRIQRRLGLLFHSIHHWPRYVPALPQQFIDLDQPLIGQRPVQVGPGLRICRQGLAHLFSGQLDPVERLAGQTVGGCLPRTKYHAKNEQKYSQSSCQFH
jgi:hypothetical protein